MAAKYVIFMDSFPKIFKSPFCLENDLNTHENIQTIFLLATCIQQCHVWTFEKYYALVSLQSIIVCFFYIKVFKQATNKIDGNDEVDIMIVVVIIIITHCLSFILNRIQTLAETTQQVVISHPAMCLSCH